MSRKRLGPTPLPPSPLRADGSSAPTAARGGGWKWGFWGGGEAAAPQNPSLSPLSPARQGKGERGVRGVRGLKTAHFAPPRR